MSNWDRNSFLAGLGGTKPHSVWLAITASLQIAKTRHLVELGAGKSTRYLAEYSKEFGETFVSIEQNDSWVSVLALELEMAQLAEFAPIHAPIVDGWYDFNEVTRAVPDTADSWLIDGPLGNDRKNAAGKAFLKERCKESRLLIVDDLHRKHLFEFFDELVAQNRWRDYVVLTYPIKPNPNEPNLIGIAMSPPSIRVLKKTLRLLDVSFVSREAKKLISEE